MSGGHQWLSIKQVIQDVSQEQNPTLAIELLLEGVVSLTRSSAGRVYVLHLEKSQFEQEFESVLESGAELGKAAQPIDVEVLEDQEAQSLIEKAIKTRQPIIHSTGNQMPLLRGHSSIAASCMAVPIHRDHSCVGVLDLESSRHNAFKEKDLHTAETAAAVALTLLEKRSTLALFREVQQPINFYQTLSDFLDELLLRVTVASRMPFIALREAEGDGRALRCIALYGLGEDKSALDLDPIEDYPSFIRALRHGETVIEADISKPHLEKLREKPPLGRVKSFVVCPIKVGTTVFGTLSFGASCPYEYSQLEIAGFETIANGIGVAIANYRNAEQLQQIFVEDAKLAVSITALEVAQSARHEARNKIDICQSRLATLYALCQKPRDNIEKIKHAIDDLGARIGEISKAMDKIRDVSRLPTSELQMVSLRDVWMQAVALVSGRMDEERVEHNVSGKDAEIQASPERLRHAFLNLLLNSLDAFKDRRTKGGRLISIAFEGRGAEWSEVRIRYTDNATGFEKTKLKIPADVDGTKPSKELIFEPGVTSKPTGSGFGLFLVRRIIDEHHGSIDLIDHKSGVVFDIVLPRYQTIAAQERREAG